MGNTGTRNRKRPRYRIKVTKKMPFELFKCQLETCNNFFSRNVYYGDPKYCGSHLDKHGNLLKQLKN